MAFALNELGAGGHRWHGFRISTGRHSSGAIHIMTLSNAFGFLLLGIGMMWLPELAPGLVATQSVFGGPSTRELWLLFMGTLNTALGAGVIGWHALLQAWRIPAWLAPLPAPRARRALRPALRPVPARAGL